MSAQPHIPEHEGCIPKAQHDDVVLALHEARIKGQTRGKIGWLLGYLSGWACALFTFWVLLND